MSKQYGLIMPNKGTKPVFGNLVTRPSVFDDDSDSDTPAPSKPTGQTKEKRQDKLNQQKAAEEDPTVYQYDEIYDEMDQKRKDSKLSRKDLDKKPKYINRLLATAERRKRENERRIERQVQKEREAEGEEFKDKESFVTSAYKKKLEEMKAMEEQERREEYLESIGDVTKQGNLDGFYRHLYDQKVLYEDNTVKTEPKSDAEDEKLTKTPEKDTQNDDTNKSDTENNKIKPQRAKKRKYRTHKDSEEQEEENTKDDNPPTVKKEHLQSNLDADSDFSIDSSDSEDEENKEPEKPNTNTTAETHERPNVLSDNANISKQSEKEEEKKVKDKEEEAIEEKPKKPKIDIWKKRTVGQIYDDAVRRYFERKALREAARNT